MSRNARGQFAKGNNGGIGMGMEVEGLEQIKAALEGAKAAVHKQSGFALNLAARRLLQVAQENAPVDTGRLKRSGRVMPTSDMGEVVETGVEFTVNYSGTIHERRGRGRKFLQKAIGSEAGEMLNLYTLGLKIGDLFSKGKRKAGLKKLSSATARGVTKSNVKSLGLGQHGGARAGAGRPRGT